MTACDLHPFIERMSKDGGMGAKILNEHVKFLDDKFHCMHQAHRAVLHAFMQPQSVGTILTWTDSKKFMKRTLSVQTKR